MKKVITYGTFDLFHQGHYNILKRAKDCGDYLIVGVTGDKYDTERGKLSVQDSLSKRIENVKKTGFADQIIVEEYLGQKISDIQKYNVDVLVVGSDWKGKFDHLRKYCEVIYLERTKDISSSLLRENTLNIYKFGIVSDTLYDNEAVIESKSVSGIHIECVFAETPELARKFADKYELDKGYSNYDEFLQNIDIVYIKTMQENRADYVRRALKRRKHVICDVPETLSIEESKELADLAKCNGVVLLDNMSTMYLQSFNQLSWITRSNLIGDIVSIKISVSKSTFNSTDDKNIMDVAYYPICVVIKLLGDQYQNCRCKLIRDADNMIQYGIISLIYANTIALVELGMKLPVEDGVLITGTDGMLFIPDDWWNLGYFKLRKKNENKFKRYSYNFDGNGFRYMIQFLLQMIKNETVSVPGISSKESRAILSVLNQIDK